MFNFASFPTLTTERLILRQLTSADAGSMIALFGTPEMLRFVNRPPIDTHAKALDLLQWFHKNYAAHDAVQWGITVRGEPQVIGAAGMYAWSRADRRVDIGYHIASRHWGRGYATEAARAVVGWCFAALDVHRVQADCTEGNDASERVLIKCGFTLEGIWRESCWEHERFVNIKQFGLLRREFMQG